MLAPEERHGIERLAITQHVPCCRLPLALRDDPVFHAHRFPRVGIGPPRDVAGGEHAGRARFEIGVDLDAAIDGQARALREIERGPHADADDDEIGGERGRVAQRDLVAGHAAYRPAEVKRHPVRLVHVADEAADVRPHHAFQRHALGRDDIDVDPARAQRRRDLEPDEARADDDHASRRRGFGDDRPAVGERAQIEDLRIGRARNRESNRVGAGRDQQRSEAVLRAVFEDHTSLLHVQRGYPRIEDEIDAALGIVLGRAQRYPVILRRAGKEVLGQVRPVARRRVVRADHRQVAVVAFAAQHVRCGEAGGAPSDDDHGGGRGGGACGPSPDLRLAVPQAARGRTPCRPPARRASRREDRAPAHAAPRRCEAKSTRDATDSGRCHRRSGRRRAVRDNACTTRRLRKERRRVEPEWRLPNRRVRGRSRHPEVRLAQPRF